MFPNFPQAIFGRFNDNLSSTYIPDKNTTNITHVLVESRFDPITVKGNLFTDTLTINSHKINNIQIMKAFAIDNPNQSSPNGFPFDVDYIILFFIVIHNIVSLRI